MNKNPQSVIVFINVYTNGDTQAESTSSFTSQNDESVTKSVNKEITNIELHYYFSQ